MNQTKRRRDLKRPKPIQRHLLVVNSPDPQAVGRKIPLQGVIELGREVEGVGLVRDERISRHHARVSCSEPRVYGLSDLDSANGTYLNGQLIEEKASLEDGSVISIGDTLLVLDVEPARDRLPANEVNPEEVEEIVGVSLCAQRLRRSVNTVAGTPGAVLLLGATGVGKEVCARAIHRLSGRAGNFVAVNCAAIPGELAESELFGHVQGAFTGAHAARVGHIKSADKGTLFLDEIGDLPSHLQSKLLRVLEESVVQPLGGDREVSVDLRIVAATSLELDRPSFRRDLYARLSDWVLHIPALKERRADVMPLLSHFAQGYRFAPEAAEALLLYDWPMNVRELKKLSARLTSLVSSASLELEHIPDEIAGPIWKRFEAEDAAEPGGEQVGPGAPALIEALKRSNGNIKRAANENGWHRTQLYRWLKRAKIDAAEYRV